MIHMMYNVHSEKMKMEIIARNTIVFYDAAHLLHYYFENIYRISTKWIHVFELLTILDKLLLFIPWHKRNQLNNILSNST